jgi:hypothetical protein
LSYERLLESAIFGHRKSPPVSATWDRDHVADRVELKTNQVGDLAFYEGVPAKV